MTGSEVRLFTVRRDIKLLERVFKNDHESDVRTPSLLDPNWLTSIEEVETIRGSAENLRILLSSTIRSYLTP